MDITLEKHLSNNEDSNNKKNNNRKDSDHEHKYNHEKNNSLKKLKGGFKLFGFGDSFTNTIKKTKSSENKLISTYETMDKSVKVYHKSYDTHIKNLEKLDDYANFHGMENLFKNVIMKDNFKDGKVDKSSPILFRNYLIQEETTPSAFRKEHIMRQVNYVLNKHFAGREHMFIKHMTVEIGKSEFVLSITTIDNRKMSRKIGHNKYVISMSETKTALKDILGTTKKNLKRKSKLIELDDYDSQAESSSSSRSSSKKKTSRRKDKYNTKTKSRSGSKKRTKSLGNSSIFNKSDNSDNSNKSKKHRMKTNTGNIDELPSGINIGNEVTKKSTKKSTLNAYLTPSKKAAKTAVQAIPPATQFATPLPVGTTVQQLPSPQGIEQRKAEILGQPNIDFQQPAAVASIPGEPAPITNANEARCNSYQGYDACRADRGCYFKAGKCNKKTSGGPGFGGPGFGGPQQYGQPPQQYGQPPAPPTQAPSTAFTLGPATPF